MDEVDGAFLLLFFIALYSVGIVLLINYVLGIPFPEKDVPCETLQCSWNNMTMRDWVLYGVTVLASCVLSLVTVVLIARWELRKRGGRHG